jgi:uncharacterized protein (TIGR02270 family)
MRPPVPRRPPLTRPINWAVLRQHVDDAAFCWMRRDAAQWDPAFTREQAGRWDSLLRAHLDGIAIAGDAATSVIRTSLASGRGAGELFVAMAAWAPRREPMPIADLEAIIGDDGLRARAAAAALCWSGVDVARPFVDVWRDRDQAGLRLASLAAAVRLAPFGVEQVVRRALSDPSPMVRTRALRAAGELRISTCMPLVQKARSDHDVRCQRAAAVALLWLGDRSAAEQAAQLLVPDSRRETLRALAVMAQVTSASAMDLFLEQLMHRAATARLAMLGMALTGRVAWIPTLLARVADPSTAATASYALIHISGVDPSTEGLWQRPAVRAEPGEPSPETLAVSPDAGLGVIDPERFAGWWSRQARRDATQLIGGRPWEREAWQQLLGRGTQLQRQQAAIGLALAGDRPALPVEAPTAGHVRLDPSHPTTAPRMPLEVAS